MRSLLVIIIAFIAGLAGAYTFDLLKEDQPNLKVPDQDFSDFTYYSQPSVPARVDPSIDFVDASEKSTASVVYIKTLSESVQANSFFDMFFGGRTSQTVSSGSGVIYTNDGYIITNYHVIENASEIKVIINKDEHTAKVVGADPSTDLAVLKIEQDELPTLSLGSSKDLKVGEWVLAVGNPFNLTSTVTAGIVSAKGRDINILQSQFPIESFIQTDAAINPGNSGGALVNVKGELVGINAAILSRTGSYAGYGFAIPMDIVKKVVDDIIGYGEVQKAFFGGDVMDLNPSIAEQLELTDLSGVVMSYIQQNGAASKAGLKKGDILLKINGEPIETRSDFEASVGSHYPGDKLDVEVKRDNKIMNKTLTLTNREGTTELLKREIHTSESLAADFEAVSKVERDILRIKNGVKIVSIRNGFMKRLGIEEGFIITAINGNPIDKPDELTDILERIKGKVVIEGVNKKGVKGYYSYIF